LLIIKGILFFGGGLITDGQTIPLLDDPLPPVKEIRGLTLRGFRRVRDVENCIYILEELN
jgi:hypothetical protein